MDIDTIMTDKIQLKVIDGVSKGGRVIEAFASNSPKKFEGKNVVITVQTSESSQGGYITGLGLMDNAAENLNTKLTFTNALQYQPIVLSTEEVAKNQADPQAAVNLLKLKIEQAGSALGRRLNSEFATGLGGTTTDGGQKIIGLRGCIDAGSELATYGGVARSGNTAIQSSTLLSAGALSASTDQQINTYWTNATIGNMTPSRIFTDFGNFNKYSDLVTLTQNVNVTRGSAAAEGRGGMGSANAVNVGIGEMQFLGAPITADADITTAYWYNVAMDAIHVYGLDMTGAEEGMKAFSISDINQLKGSPFAGINTANLGVNIRKMMRAERQLGFSTQLVWGGQMIAEESRRHSKIQFG